MHGAVAAAKVALGLGLIEEAEQKRRLGICAACTAVDTKGDRLYRGPYDNPSCGIPAIQKLLRDDTLDGCGCYVKEKAKAKDEHCPLSKW